GIGTAELAREKLLRFYDVTDDPGDAARLRGGLKPELLRRYLSHFGDQSRPHFLPKSKHFFKGHLLTSGSEIPTLRNLSGCVVEPSSSCLSPGLSHCSICRKAKAAT